MTTVTDYQQLVDFYDTCFKEHGATPKGVDWPNAQDLEKRFTIMMNVCHRESTQSQISILDLGCGYGALVDFLSANNPFAAVHYWGIDLSEAMIDNAKSRYPNMNFEIRDILQNPLPDNCVDYVIMNGLLTEKRNLSQDQMETFAKTIIKAAFKLCRKGIAFNVMNAHVDWFRDELFHWEFDKVAAFLKQECSRHVAFRADYGLYEYTTYVHKEPV